MRACHIVLLRYAPWGQKRDARSHEQGTLGALERSTERFDGALFLRAALGHFGEIVMKRGVDYAVRLGGTAPQAIEIRERTAVNLGSRLRKRLNSLVRAGEAKHLMPGGNQFFHDGRSNPTGGACDEYTHISTSESAIGSTLSAADMPVKP